MKVTLSAKLKYPKLFKIAKYLALTGYTLKIINQDQATRFAMRFAEIETSVE